MSGVTVLDFETYYDQDYTLKKLTVEQYVRDDRFEVHCVGVWTPEEGAILVPPYDDPNGRSYLAKYVTGRTVICQKAQFDGLILSHWYDLRPENWICTLSMARAVLPQLTSHSLDALTKHYGLPAKTIDYQAFKGQRDLDEQTFRMLSNGCLHDVMLTKTIAEKLIAAFPRNELPVVDMTIRMFTEPKVQLDTTMANAELLRIKGAKEQALNSLGVTREQLQSADKFCELLRAQGVEPPMKESPRVAGKMIPAIAKVDQGMKDLQEHHNPVVAQLAAARLGEKSTLLETRIERLIGMAGRGDLCLHLNYAGAGNTLRWSGGDKMNAQNFPPAIQKALVAPEGYKFIKTDSAQIECRLLNYFAGQEDVVEAFRAGRDIYSEVATRFYGRPVTKSPETKTERHLGKVSELGCGYGMGWVKFQYTAGQGALGGPPIHLTDVESKAVVDLYRHTHPHVCALWRKYDRWLAEMYRTPPEQRRFTGPAGLWLDWSELTYDGNDYYRGDQKVYGALVVENIIQHLGRVFLAEVAVRVKKLYPQYWLALCTHDDTVHLVPENDNDAGRLIGEQFKIPPAWAPGLPLSYDSHEGKRYSS